MHEIVREILTRSGEIVRRKGLSVHVRGNLHGTIPLDKEHALELLTRLFLEAASSAPCNTMVTITSSLVTGSWTCSVEHRGHEFSLCDDRCTGIIETAHGTMGHARNDSSPGSVTSITIPIA